MFDLISLIHTLSSPPPACTPVPSGAGPRELGLRAEFPRCSGSQAASLCKAGIFYQGAEPGFAQNSAGLPKIHMQPRHHSCPRARVISSPSIRSQGLDSTLLCRTEQIWKGDWALLLLDSAV